MTSHAGLPTGAAYPTRDEDGHLLTTEFGLCVYKNHQTVIIQVRATPHLADLWCRRQQGRQPTHAGGHRDASPCSCLGGAQRPSFALISVACMTHKHVQVKSPACCAAARTVQQCRRRGVVPAQGMCKEHGGGVSTEVCTHGAPRRSCRRPRRRGSCRAAAR